MIAWVGQVLLCVYRFEHTISDLCRAGRLFSSFFLTWYRKRDPSRSWRLVPPKSLGSKVSFRVTFGYNPIYAQFQLCMFPRSVPPNIPNTNQPLRACKQARSQSWNVTRKLVCKCLQQRNIRHCCTTIFIHLSRTNMFSACGRVFGNDHIPIMSCYRAATVLNKDRRCGRCNEDAMKMRKRIQWTSVNIVQYIWYSESWEVNSPSFS